MQYRTGLVELTQGETEVIGIDTLWIANASVGDIFVRPGHNVPYIVATINDNTSIELSAPYAGPSESGVSYAISRSFTPNKNYPFPERGDVETAQILKRALTQIDLDLDSLPIVGTGFDEAPTNQDLIDGIDRDGFLSNNSRYVLGKKIGSVDARVNSLIVLGQRSPSGVGGTLSGVLHGEARVVGGDTTAGSHFNIYYNAGGSAPNITGRAAFDSLGCADDASTNHKLVIATIGGEDYVCIRMDGLRNPINLYFTGVYGDEGQDNLFATTALQSSASAIVDYPDTSETFLQYFGRPGDVIGNRGAVANPNQTLGGVTLVGGGLSDVPTGQNLEDGIDTSAVGGGLFTLHKTIVTPGSTVPTALLFLNLTSGEPRSTVNAFVTSDNNIGGVNNFSVLTGYVSAVQSPTLGIARIGGRLTLSASDVFNKQDFRFIECTWNGEQYLGVLLDGIRIPFSVKLTGIITRGIEDDIRAVPVSEISNIQDAITNNIFFLGSPGDNIDRTDGNYGFDGNVIVPAGSGNSPSITTSGDLDTGRFFPAPDTIAEATGGVERLRITPDGNLLIGTTADPGRVINAQGADAAFYGIRVGRGGGGHVQNVVVGQSALSSNTSGTNNSTFGYLSMESNTSGLQNSAFGAGASRFNLTGSENSAFGYVALQNNTSDRNSAFGRSALKANTSGSNNTAVGYNALSLNTTGNFSVAVGAGALRDNEASGNTAVGYTALNTNTVGSRNTALGNSALLSNTTGSDNTAVGDAVLSNNPSGSHNTAIGTRALDGLSFSGSENTALGRGAGFNMTTGSGNIVIGSRTSAGNFLPVFNITGQDDRISMGSTAVTDAYIQVAWTVVSDERDKTNFGVVPHGLDFINKLNPIAYQYRENRESDVGVGPTRYGFKAQDILALEGENPVIVDAETPEKLRMRDDSLVPVLVKAIQELTQRLERLGGDKNG